LGQTAFALRLLPAISGTLAIPALYLLARQITGPRIALIAAALLAFSHSHLNFSRTAAVGYIHDTWIVPLVLFLLLSGLEKRQSWRTALAGILLGFQLSIYLTAQIFIPLVFIFCLFILIFFRKGYPQALRNLLSLWGGLLVVAIPSMLYAINHPAEFFNRLNVDGTLQSGWLALKMAETGQMAIQILAERVRHAFFSLIYYPAIDFYNSPVPLVSIVTASLFLLGLGISLWKTRSSGYLLLNGYFWGCTLAVGIFAIPESADSYRMIMTLPAVMLFASIGLHQVLSALNLGWAQSHKGYILVTGFLMVNLLFFNVWEYRVDFAGRCRYGGDQQTRFASYLGTYLQTVRRETTVYLLSDDIFRYGTHASAEFLGMRKAVINVVDPVDSIAVISGDVIIASPNRIDELAAWARQHPGGELKYTYDCELEIMESYQVP
jgi:4-amino-4-deoxy-L-arabinose transferase-like glycosyltransferase